MLSEKSTVKKLNWSLQHSVTQRWSHWRTCHNTEQEKTHMLFETLHFMWLYIINNKRKQCHWVTKETFWNIFQDPHVKNTETKCLVNGSFGTMLCFQNSPVWEG